MSGLITANTVLQFLCRAVFVLFIACSVCFGQIISLSGAVSDSSNGGNVSSAKLNLESVGSPVPQSFKTVSDMFGRYEFKDLPEGEYKAIVSRLGYKTETVSEIQIYANSKKTLNIILTPVDIEIDRINVTATKTELTLKQTPSSINIVSSQEIQKRNFLTFDNVLNSVQGVTVFKTSGINVQSLSIRGSSDVAGGGIGNRVLLLLDGRPSLTGDSKGALWSLIPFSIIDRTEVVKGAFSSLYGSSAIGGVVNVITKKPTYKPFTAVNFNYGFYEKLNDSLAFTNELLTFKSADIFHSNTYKKLAYLLNFSYNQNDGHAQQTDYEFYSGLGKFMYDVFRNRDLEVTFQFTKSDGAFPHYWRKDPGGISEPFKTAPSYIGDRIKKETQSIDVFYTALPSSKSKYTSRFYYYKLYSLSYYNPNNIVSIQFAPPGQALETTIKSYNFGNISQFDFQLSSRNYLISGLDLQWNVVKSNPESILYGDQQVNNFGLFVQDQHKIITDKSGNSVFSTTAGIRADYNKFVGLNHFVQFSPKLSFLYTPISNNAFLSNTAFRFLVGRAFRAPSIAELYFKKELFGGFDFIFNPNLKPEEMVSAELGFRKQFEEMLTLDISAYINEYDNLIQYVNIGNTINGPFQVQNIAKAQIKGLELLIDYNSSVKLFNERLDIGVNTNYSLIDARDLSANRKNEYLPYKPSHIVNFSTNLNYRGFNFNVAGKYVSKVDEDLFYKYEEPGDYFLLDMKLSMRVFDAATIFFAVNNVLNESYQELERTQAPNRNFNSGVKIEF